MACLDGESLRNIGISGSRDTPVNLGDAKGERCDVSYRKRLVTASRH